MAYFFEKKNFYSCVAMFRKNITLLFLWYSKKKKKKKKKKNQMNVLFYVTYVYIRTGQAIKIGLYYKL